MKNPKNIGIIGAGAWGTAMAAVLARAGHQVRLWAFEKEVVQDINENHRNTQFLPQAELPANLTASSQLQEVLKELDYLIIATPSLFTLPIVKQLLVIPEILEGNIQIGVLTKGFIASPRGNKLMLQAIEDYLPGIYKDNLVYISGPSHAEEVVSGKLTALIAASKNPHNAIRFKHLLNVAPLMVFSSLDTIGVQVSAAVKNVIAIAFGMLDALKESSNFVGDNTESLLLAAGLNEIQTLATALGSSHPSKTLTSIAGVGDLDVTCRSIHGRNRRFGREIIFKNALESFTNLEDLLHNYKRLGYLPEGAAAVAIVKDYISSLNLRMPITMGVYRVLNKEAAPLDEVKNFLKALAGDYELLDPLERI